MTTAYITHPLFISHEIPEGHPECPARLSAINDRLHVLGIYDLLLHHDAPKATRQQLERAHSARLIDALTSVSPDTGLVHIDADTFMGPHSLEAAWHAAGAAVLATDLVMDGSADNAFCAVRPPGHHAERGESMGFCFFNNVAVGVCQALEVHGLERVLVLDFDVHRGNGTEEIFANDDRVLICGSFQHPCYPLMGLETKSPQTVNLPLPAGTRSADYHNAIEERWLPAIENFRPQMIFVSAGFDAHAEDLVAELLLTDNDYLWLTETIVDIAHRHAHGRVVSCLEGGYALRALSRCVGLHIRTLAGL